MRMKYLLDSAHRGLPRSDSSNPLAEARCRHRAALVLVEEVRAGLSPAQQKAVESLIYVLGFRVDDCGQQN